MEVRSDCPDCRSAGSVERGVCQVCFVETPDPLAGSRPAANGTGAAAVIPVPLRFADVISEIEAVAELAELDATGNLADACVRARRLLERLRGQFLAEVILAPPGTPPVPEAAAPGAAPALGAVGA